jgi:hypothetical protein
MENINLKSLLQSDKNELNQLIGYLTDGVDDGYSLEAYITAKKLEYVAKSMIEYLQPIAINEAEKYKGTTLFASEIQVKDTGVKYDYLVCNYSPYNSLIAQKKQIESEQKTMESLLKSISKPTTIVDDATGEVLEVKPPLRTSGTSIVLTIK